MKCINHERARSYLSPFYRAVIYCNSVHAEVPKISEIKCGDAIIRIESYCSMDNKENQIVCSKQILSFENQKTHKKRSQIVQDALGVLSLPITEWSCSQGGKEKKYIELSFCNNGNCEILMDQHIELWTTTGKLLTPQGKNYDNLVKKFSIKSTEPNKVIFY